MPGINYSHPLVARADRYVFVVQVRPVLGGIMHVVRTIILLTSVSVALFVGGVSPAAAAKGMDKAQATDSGVLHFGTYSTLAACQYFGDSLVASRQFRSYNCWHHWFKHDPNLYWALYVSR